MKKNKNLTEWLAGSVLRLKDVTDTPQLEAQLIAAHVLNQSRTRLLAHLDQNLNGHQEEGLEELLAERLQLFPLPYLLGRWSFYGLDFFISPAVLIPRPETELLVSETINWFQNHPHQNHMVDVGTGSGCIAISVTGSLPSITALGIDISMPALKIAKRNAIEHRVDPRISFIQSDLLTAVAGFFDVLCANLPYIPTAKLAALPVRLFEPVIALDGGADGLDFIRRLLAQSISRISPGGLLLFEIEAGQGEPVLQLARETYPQSKCQILADLAGLPRLLRIEVKR